MNFGSQSDDDRLDEALDEMFGGRLTGEYC